MIKTILASSRFVVGIAVLATFAGSVALLAISIVTVARLIWDEITNFSTSRVSANHVEHLGVQFIQVTDIILLGIVLYIVAVGLYQLFIDPHLPVPKWLRVHDLIELKRDLISVTVVLLGVTFLGQVVDWDGETTILNLGVAIALVVIALGAILWLTPNTPVHEEEEPVAASGAPEARRR
jgi:uncharacterized membrane protein YqhA